MVKAHREMDEALQEPPFRLLGRGPHLLENFVTVEKLATIEQFDPFTEQDRAACFILMPHIVNSC